MGIFRQFPYSNFHELNIDWFLNEFRNLEIEWNSFDENWEGWKNGVDEGINNIWEYLNNLPLTDEVREILTEMYNNGDLLALIAPFLPFVTPQMFGAKGDGINDDTDALNECLHANAFVIIPKGFYKITSTITTYCRDVVTVIADSKAMFINGGVVDYMFKFSEFIGYSHFGVNWTGGIFNMNGSENITGILVNSYCSFGVIKDIIIIDVGNNSTGIEINIVSGKNIFDNVRIFGASFTYDINNPNSNIAVNSYDLTRNNTGIKVLNSYDFAFTTLYIMGCNIGIFSSGSSQIDVGQYHYWLGTGPSGNLISTAQYLKSRAFKSDNTGDYWHFNMFYPDQPYIAAECNFITCDNTHYILIKPESLTDNEAPTAFLGKMLNDYGNMVFENLDVTRTGRAEFRGVNASSLAFRRGEVYITDAYNQRFEYIHPSLMMNNLSQNMQFTYERGGGWKLLGYLCIQIQGACNIQIGSTTNVFSIIADLICKDYNATVRNALSYQGSQTYDNYMGFGNRVTINNFTWLPVYLKSDYDGAAASFPVFMKVSGLTPFMFAPTDEYVDTLDNSTILPTEKTQHD